MRAILIQFPDSGIPVFQFIGDSDSEVAFLRGWVDKNLNGKVEEQTFALALAEPAFLAGGKCGRIHPTLSKAPATFGFYSE
jgi:hypothetical protein